MFPTKRGYVLRMRTPRLTCRGRGPGRHATHVAGEGLVKLTMEYILDFLSGRPSAQPSPSSRKGKRKNEDGCSGTASGNTQSVGSASARRAAEKEEGVHGILTSALWAVARTPALVEAIERANASFGEVSSPLSCILDQLRHAGDADNLPEAAKAAHAFLRDRRLTFYDSMEPMEAIRSIVGLCVDSDRVLQEAVGTTYRLVYHIDYLVSKV